MSSHSADCELEITVCSMIFTAQKKQCWFWKLDIEKMFIVSWHFDRGHLWFEMKLDYRKILKNLLWRWGAMNPRPYVNNNNIYRYRTSLVNCRYGEWSNHTVTTSVVIGLVINKPNSLSSHTGWVPTQHSPPMRVKCWMPVTLGRLDLLG